MYIHTYICWHIDWAILGKKGEKTLAKNLETSHDR